MREALTDERYGLFERVGIELEYMIVDRTTCAVRPLADRLLVDEEGQPIAEVEHGDLAWSNELVQHVLEFKTNGPVPDLEGLSERFQGSVNQANTHLAPLGAALMSGAMHPTMRPDRETVLWPYEYGPVYETFDRIFGCSGHGWANLQSVHLNLPFRNDDEFERLHAAIRTVLPIIPALAAASPVMEGRVQPWLDTRLEMYRHNARRLPSVSGMVVPEPARSESEYRHLILERIYRDLAPLDPGGVLRHEWVNARGAIARFDRNTIEIRVIDAQECPVSDIAVGAAVLAAVRSLAEETASPPAQQNGLSTELLAGILEDTIRDADQALISSADYLAIFGWEGPVPCLAADLWRHLARFAADTPGSDQWGPGLERILADGCLARRILRELNPGADYRAMRDVCGMLMRCLERGEPLQSPA